MEPSPSSSTPGASTSPSSLSADPSRKIFVGNLNRDTKEEDLNAAFSSAGPIVSINIIPRPSGTPYAFIVFSSPEIASAAVSSFQNFSLSGNLLTVEACRPSPSNHHNRNPRRNHQSSSSRSNPGNRSRGNGSRYGAKRSGNYRMRGHDGPETTRALSPTEVFVSNIPFTFDDARLRLEFAAYSPVEARIVRDGQFRVFGFVSFADADTARAAIGDKSGRIIEGRKIIVRQAYEKETQDS